ncbi:MAG: hypothetical protein ABI863_05420 [Ginsengibacter sp.]
MEDEELSIKDMISKAHEAEGMKDNKLAIELYRKVIKSDKLNMYAYDRIMKILRQVKDYKKELAIINSAIGAYEQFYKSEARAKSKKVSEISQKLNRSFGLTDKKGNNVYSPEPIARWKKRRANVGKKLK